MADAGCQMAETRTEMAAYCGVSPLGLSSRGAMKATFGKASTIPDAELLEAN